MQNSVWQGALVALAEALIQVIPIAASILVLYLGILATRLRSTWAAKAEAQTAAADAQAEQARAAAHAADVALIKGALASEALTAAAGYLNNRFPTVEAAANHVATYGLNTVGGTILKVGLESPTLRAMAASAVNDAIAKIGGPAQPAAGGGL